jgi:hypothetical protein
MRFSQQCWEDSSLQGYDTIWTGMFQMFWRSFLLPPSGYFQGVIISKDLKLQILHSFLIYALDCGDSFMSLVKYPLERTLDGLRNLSGDGNVEETLHCYRQQTPISPTYTPTHY